MKVVGSLLRLSDSFDAFTDTTGAGVTDPLTLASATAVTTPPVGSLRMISRQMAGKEVPGFIDSTGDKSTLQQHFGTNYVCYCGPVPASITPSYVSMPVGTFLGATAVAPVANGTFNQRLNKINLVSAATAGALSYVFWPSAWLCMGSGSAGSGGFLSIFRFTVSDAVAGNRMFVGLSNSIIAPTNVEPNTVLNTIGMAKLAASTNYQMISAGTSAAAAIDLGAGFPVSDTNGGYELQLYNSSLSNTTIFWKVTNLNSGAIQTGSFTNGIPGTTVPDNTKLLAPRQWRTNNATGAAVTHGFVKFYNETDN